MRLTTGVSQSELLDTVAKQAKRIQTLQRELTRALGNARPAAPTVHHTHHPRLPATGLNNSFATLDGAASDISMVEPAGDGVSSSPVRPAVARSHERQEVGGHARGGEKARLVNALVSDLERRVATLNTEVGTAIITARGSWYSATRLTECVPGCPGGTTACLQAAGRSV